MKIDNDYKNGWRYIVWTGGVDNYFKKYEDAKINYDALEDAGYDGIYLTKLKLYGNEKILEKKEIEQWVDIVLTQSVLIVRAL